MIIHPFKWNTLSAEELTQVRTEAIDEVFNMKQKALDLQEMSKMEQMKHYAKELALDIYMKSYAYLFDYNEYLKYSYKWVIYNDIKDRQATIPRPNNWLSSAVRTMPIEKATQPEREDADDRECKYPDED